jgi:hypothetical protein
MMIKILQLAVEFMLLFINRLQLLSNYLSCLIGLDIEPLKVQDNTADVIL